MNATTLSSIAFDCTGNTEQSAVIMQLLHDMVRSLEEKNSDADIYTDSRLEPTACDDGFGPTPKMSDFIRSAQYSFLTYPAASSKKLRLSCSNEHAVETNCDVSIMSYDGLAAAAVLNEESVEGGMGSSIGQYQQPEPHQLNCQSLYGQHPTFDGPLQQMYIDINTDREIVPSYHLPPVDEAMRESIARYDDLPPISNEAMNEGFAPSHHLPLVDEVMNEGTAHYDGLPPYNESMKEDIAPSDHLPLVDEGMSEGIAHIVDYSTSASASKDTRHEDFQSLWLQRKQLVEAAAEAKARHLFRQRQRDQVSLEASIDSSLREYGDMHEQAHALRLQFEDEKHRWMTTVLETARTAENTPGKRQRVPQSSPYSYYRDHTQQQQQQHYSRAAAADTSGSSCTGDEQSILSTPGGCEDLHVQFQYEADRYEVDQYEPQLPAQQQDPLRYPNSKRQKRFLVPIKVKVQE